MRLRHLIWLPICIGLGVLPVTARADGFADARMAMQHGDLHAAQSSLRDVVRSDPQNADAHYWLGKVDLDLGDPVAAEHEARQARDRGFDPHEAVSLLAQTLLAQQKYQDLLNELRPGGKDPKLDAAILVSRGFAQFALKDIDAAQASFALAEKTTPDAVGPWLADARLLASRGDLDGAQAKVDQALAAQPESPEALLAKAEILRAKGNAAAALTVLDQLLTIQPENVPALLARAGLLIATNQSDKAKVDLDTVLKAMPGNVQAIYLQAVLQVQAKDYQAADATLVKINGYIGRIQRGDFLLAIVKQQLGQAAQAEAAIRRYIARVPQDFAAYNLLAQIELAEGHADVAADLLAKVVGSGHAGAEAYDLLGRAYAATGRGDDAVKAFQKAEELAPNDVGLQTRMAGARLGIGKAESAVDDLEHTLKLAPTAPQVGEALFFAALATGDMSKARDAIDKVRAAQGDTPVVENLEGLLKLAQLDDDAAAVIFRDIMQAHPEFLPAQINLAHIAALQGNMTEAERILSAILVKHPAAEPALTMLAAQYMQSDRTPLAIALVEQAHTAQPANKHLTVSLGELYIRSGKPADALAMVNSDAMAAGDVELLNLKAAAQIALDQNDQARETDTRILKIDPSQLAARRQLENLLLQAGDFDRARVVIKDGLVISPRNYQLYQDYVTVDLKAGGFDAAVATAKQLQEQDRDFEEARALVGDLYMAAERKADAIKAFQDALAEAPSELLVRRLTGALVSDGQGEAAIKLLADWIAQHPMDLSSTQQLADLEIVAKRYDDAVKLMLRVLDTKPHNGETLNNLAWVYQQQGDSRAEAIARQAYIQSPDGETADTLGWILVSGGDPAKGVPLLRQAAAQAGSDPRILYHLAVGLNQLGQKEAAIKLLNAVVANQTEFEEKVRAQRLLGELGKS